MTSFADSLVFEVEKCCKCGMPFAMTQDYQQRRRQDRAAFYCPSGHGQHYTGPTEAQKLKVELARQTQMLDAAQSRALTAEAERASVAKAHRKMRERVMNGVCPCCNRTFQNLMQHMKSEHSDFAEIRSMLTLRKAFGMTQADIAREAGVDGTHVSLYERGLRVGDRAKTRLDLWLQRHVDDDDSAKENATPKSGVASDRVL